MQGRCQWPIPDGESHNSRIYVTFSRFGDDAASVAPRGRKTFFVKWKMLFHKVNLLPVPGVPPISGPVDGERSRPP